MNRSDTRSRIADSTTFRALTLAALCLMLLIPLASVRGIVEERKGQRSQAASSVAEGWGGPQTLLGPVLVIQAGCSTTESDGEVRESRHLAVKLPARLAVEGQATSEVRKRGLHTVPVYRAKLRFDLSFEPPPVAALDWRCTTTRIEATSIVLALGDPRGIDGLSPVSLGERGDRRTAWRSGTPLEGDWRKGVQAPVPVEWLYPAAGPVAMTFELELRGSDRFALAPAGAQTELRLAGDWPSPSFDGSFLPSERHVTAEGFDALWKVSELARPVPSLWLSETAPELAASAFGVSWFQPADGYLMTERSLKYGFLFVALTFLTFFLFEQAGATRVHPIQYGLVGGALCVFYLLLLAISERAGFGRAYLVAAVATASLIVFYGKALLRAGRRVGVLAAVLAVLYGGLYLLVGLEEAALLIGSVALFLIIAIAMWTTREVGREKPGTPAGAPNPPLSPAGA